MVTWGKFELLYRSNVEGSQCVNSGYRDLLGAKVGNMKREVEKSHRSVILHTLSGYTAVLESFYSEVN